MATPTNTPQPGTPPGRYEIEEEQNKTNCATVGVTGSVKEKGDDDPVPYVTIEVKGDESDYKGPYIGKTDQNGKYNIVIGELKDDLDGVTFKAKVIGDGAESEDTAKWTVSSDCEDDDGTQVYQIDWIYKK